MKLDFAGLGEDRVLRQAFTISTVIHVLVFLLAFFFGQAMQRAPMLQLTEIDFVEMEEIPLREEIAEPQPKSLLQMVKRVIPVKQRPSVRTPKKAPSAPAAPKPAPPKRRYMGGAPLISKKMLSGSRMSGKAVSEPMISKKSIGRGISTGTPKWEKGPGARTGGGGRRLNLAMSMALPQSQRRGVVDADIAASLKGKRGTLSMHKSGDVRGIIAGVSRGKRARLAATGRGGGSGANLGGFRDAFAVFGEIKNRKILRMKMPRYPAWAEEQGIEATVTIRVGIFADGLVEESSIYIESTSGYPQLDKLAVQSVAQAVWAPLSSKKKPMIQYGSIRFAFRLKR